MKASVPRVLTTPLEKPIARVLARYLLRRIAKHNGAASDFLVLLPNNRSCKQLRHAMQEESGKAALLLPRILPFDALDGDAALLTGATHKKEALQAFLDVPPAISPLKARVWLTHHLAAQKDAGFSFEQAAALAQELWNTLEEMEREQVPLSRLAEVVPSDLAQHWEHSYDTLRVLEQEWPAYLSAHGMVTPAGRRNRIMSLVARHWQEQAPSFPVIAAGTTGSIPATAQLLQVIADLPQGEVILPGLDLHSSDEAWNNVEASHPQANLKHLLEILGVPRESVTLLDDAVAASVPPQRLQLLLEAMAPAAATGEWRNTRIRNIAAAVENVSMIPCRDEGEEAELITLLLRETLETPDKTAALVTQDELLARRVAAGLARFGITVRPYEGRELLESSLGSCMKLSLHAVASQFAPVPLLALLRHGCCLLGMPRWQGLRAVEAIEHMALRGLRPSPGLAAISTRLAHLGEKAEEASAYWQRFEHAMQPLESLFQQDSRSWVEMIGVLISAVEALTQSGDDETSSWHSDEGQVLRQSMDELVDVLEPGQRGSPHYLAMLLDDWLGGEFVDSSERGHKRLMVLSPREARFQHADRVVMGGMSEGTWPKPQQGGSLISPAMRRLLGLPPLERAIGMDGHDMLMLASAPECFATYAERKQGDRTSPSRWLQRLQAMLEIHHLPHALEAGGVQWLTLVRRLRREHTDARQPVRLSPPRPAPPLALRPRKLAATQLQTLMKDPYAIYARHILRLNKLEELDMQPEAADFGNLVHAAFHLFHQRHTPPGANTYAQLIACGEEVFASWRARPAVNLLWWPRFQRIAEFASETWQTREGLERILSEISLSALLALPGGAFEINARVDAVEYYAGGNIAIMDYKTGRLPETKYVELGYDCQLAIEAWLMTQQRPPVAPQRVRELLYWLLSGTEDKGREKSALAASGLDDGDWPQEIEEKLRMLLSHYDAPETAYLSRPLPELENPFSDYAHLARIAEWEPYLAEAEEESIGGSHA